MADLIIANGRIIDPANNIDKVADLAIADGKIEAIGENLAADAKGAEVIDAKGKIVAPGLIDIHVHLREPGDEEEETIASGSAAAVAGGFTSIVCMPNTEPAIDSEATVDFVYRQAARADMANVFASGAITKGRCGEELAEMGQMVRAGAVAFTDDGTGVQNPAVMLKAFNYVKMFDKVLMQHCQCNAIAGSGVMNSGYHATVLGLPGMSHLAEELMLQRDIQLAKACGGRIHAQHISTAGAVKILRQGKAEGVSVTAEVTPHHLLLTEECVYGYDTNYKMNPPLRRQKDVEAVREAVADGTIDCLVTDHAPHLLSEKELEFLTAPFGIVGLDCAFGLYAKALIEEKVCDWPRMIEMMTIKPAQIVNIDKGTLSVGADADITIIDPDMKWSVDVNEFKSQSKNCPWHGWELPAKPVCTIVKGVVKFKL